MLKWLTRPLAILGLFLVGGAIPAHTLQAAAACGSWRESYRVTTFQGRARGPYRCSCDLGHRRMGDLSR